MKIFLFTNFSNWSWRLKSLQRVLTTLIVLLLQSCHTEKMDMLLVKKNLLPFCCFGRFHMCLNCLCGVSSGISTRFAGSDSIPVKLDDIYTQFDNECTGLRGKPKLFLLQACRGGRDKLCFLFFPRWWNPKVFYQWFLPPKCTRNISTSTKANQVLRKQ